jgi:hypothetical protein
MVVTKGVIIKGVDCTLSASLERQMFLKYLYHEIEVSILQMTNQMQKNDKLGNIIIAFRSTKSM